jgi:hypothetical protein
MMGAPVTLTIVNLTKLTNQNQELNPCVLLCMLSVIRPDYSGQRRTDFHYSMVAGSYHHSFLIIECDINRVSCPNWEAQL